MPWITSLEAPTSAFYAQVSSEEVKKACPVPFEEGRLWKGKDGPQLKRQLQAHFHNITRTMDCVGCEKCKLWGKLQLLGEQPSGTQVSSSSE